MTAAVLVSGHDDGSTGAIGIPTVLGLTLSTRERQKPARDWKRLMSSVDLFEPAAPQPARQYVTYFDEVKAMPKNGQNFYLVGGIAVPMDEIGRVEDAVTALAEQVFRTRELVPEAEFHAGHIYFGKGSFEGKIQRTG